MTIVDKIKSSIEAATSVPLYYQSEERLNEILDSAQFPCAFLYILTNQQLTTDSRQFRERLQVAVFFVEPTEFDFVSVENERIIDNCKRRALKWLQGMNTDKWLRLVAINNTERVYDVMDAVLTGFAVNVTIEELTGVCNG